MKAIFDIEGNATENITETQLTSNSNDPSDWELINKSNNVEGPSIFDVTNTYQKVLICI